MTLFGQSCLAARRLIEAGGRFVTVFWDGFGLFGTGAWDTHANHYPRLKEYLLPGFDLAYSALLDDLDERGLLDETLVLWLSEHGRTPQIDSKPPGAGRHHWSRVYSTVYAGGGIGRGQVVGAPIASAATSATPPSPPRTSWRPPSTCSASIPRPPCPTASTAPCGSSARGACARNCFRLQ